MSVFSQISPHSTCRRCCYTFTTQSSCLKGAVLIPTRADCIDESDCTQILALCARAHERWKPRVRLLYTLRLPARLVGHAHNWGSFVQEGGGGEGGGGAGGGG